MTDERERTRDEDAAGEPPLPAGLEAALRVPPAGRAPAGFSAAVMAQVRAAGPSAVAAPDLEASPGAALVRRLRRGLLITWLAAGLPAAALLALVLGSLGGGPSEGAAPVVTGGALVAGLQDWSAAWAAGLAGAAPELLAIGSLAAAAAATVGALALARLTGALVTRRASA